MNIILKSAKWIWNKLTGKNSENNKNYLKSKQEYGKVNQKASNKEGNNTADSKIAIKGDGNIVSVNFCKCIDETSSSSSYSYDESYSSSEDAYENDESSYYSSEYSA